MTEKIDILNEFVPDTGANAIKVNQNFNKIKDTINSSIDDVSDCKNLVDDISNEIDDILNINFIGQIVTLCRSDIPGGVLPCNGGQYERSIFPTFFKDYLLSGKVLSCSFEEYNADINTYGYCGKCALDNLNGYFKVPYIPDGVFIAGGVNNLGKSYKEGLPSIDHTHTFSYTPSPYSASLASGGTFGVWSGGTTTTGGMNETLSSIYGASNNVTPKHIRYKYGIVVANISQTPSEIIWSEVLANLDNKISRPKEIVDEVNEYPIINIKENSVYKFSNVLSSLIINSYDVSNLSSYVYFESGDDATILTLPINANFLGSLKEVTPNGKYVLSVLNGFFELKSTTDSGSGSGTYETQLVLENIVTSQPLQSEDEIVEDTAEILEGI